MLREGPGAEVTKGYAPALSAVGCAAYHPCGWRDPEAGGGGTGGAAVSVCLRPRLRGCESVGSAAAEARAWVFWAADCVSSAAFLPELTPPPYGSGCCKRGCLRLSSPMRCVAGGSGDDAAVAARRRLHRSTPIHLAVSVHECWWGGICSLSGSGLSEERALLTTADKCASTMWRLRTVPGEEGAPSLIKSLETEMTFSKMAAAAASLRASGEASGSGVAAKSTIAGGGGGGAKSLGSSSTFPKKWAMAAMCLHSWTLGQSGQSQDCSPRLT